MSSAPHILVVDDEAPIIELVAMSLEKHGFRCVPASDGPGAIDAFVAHRDSIVAVVLDMEMPRMTGGEVLLELRRLSRDVPVVLCSGYSESEIASRVQDDDASRFLSKPYSPRELLAALREALAAAEGSGGPSA